MASRCDWAPVEAAQRGDRDAFGKLYTQHVGTVSRFVASRVFNPVLVEDFTSETFLRALRYIDSVSYRGRDVDAWLITIARNLILDHIKSRRYRLEKLVAEFYDGEDYRMGPEPQVIGRSIGAHVRHCVNRLPNDQRECVQLRFLCEMSIAETAARMGRSGAAIKGLTRRGVTALRVKLPDHLNMDS